jgi:hypothetical protein
LLGRVVLSVAVVAPMTPSDCLSTTRHFPVAPVIGGHASRSPQERGRGGSPQFPGQPCGRSVPPTPGGSWAPAPGPEVPSVAFALLEGARLLLDPPEGGRHCRRCRIHVMLRTGHSPPLPHEGRDTPLRRTGSLRRRGPRYPGPWRLPGPDLHRLADLSLSLGLSCGITSSVSSIGARAVWAHSRAAGGWRSGPLTPTLL